MALSARHAAIAQRLSDSLGLTQEDTIAAVKQNFEVLRGLLDGTGPPCLLARIEVGLLHLAFLLVTSGELTKYPQKDKMLLTRSEKVIHGAKSVFIMRNTVGTKPVDLDKVCT